MYLKHFMPVLKTRQKLTRVMIFLTDSALTKSKREVLHLSPGPLAPLPSQMLSQTFRWELLRSNCQGCHHPGQFSSAQSFLSWSIVRHRGTSWDIGAQVTPSDLLLLT